MDLPKQTPAPIYLRITPAVFFKELVELGFKDEHAKEIVGWLQVISDTKIGGQSGHSFLAGKKTSVIKGCLAYIGSRVLDEPNYYGLVQRTIGVYFKVGSKEAIATYKKYVTFLRQKNPSLFKLNRDLRKDQFS
jgi:hypothetical protein